MSLNLTTIKTALATQISAYSLAGGGRQVNVRPYRMKTGPPCITMAVTDITYFESMGSNGYAQILLDLTVTVTAGDRDSEEIVMDAFLSVGTGNASSIADAVNSSVTLGGVVESCVVLEVGAPHDTDDGYEAVFPLKILTRKAGAQV